MRMGNLLKEKSTATKNGVLPILEGKDSHVHARHSNLKLRRSGNVAPF